MLLSGIFWSYIVMFFFSRNSDELSCNSGRTRIWASVSATESAPRTPQSLRIIREHKKLNLLTFFLALICHTTILSRESPKHLSIHRMQADESSAFVVCSAFAITPIPFPAVPGRGSDSQCHAQIRRSPCLPIQLLPGDSLVCVKQHFFTQT